MIDKEKILAKIDELNSYLEELEEIKPKDFEDYSMSTEKRRACERLLQISIEVVIDITNIITSNLKLGIPSDEDELFEKLKKKKIISEKVEKILKGMKGFRNILVHKYEKIDDELVFEKIDRIDDFDLFIEEIKTFIDNYKLKNS